MIRTLCLFFILICLLLAACEPPPTPFPVDIPVTPTVTPPPTAVPEVRYALGLEARGFVAELDQIEASAEVEQLTEPANPADLGTRYDIIVTYGEYSGWTRSEVLPHVMLVFHPSVEPLDPQLAGILRRRIDPQAVEDALSIPGLITVGEQSAASAGVLRTEMANLGRPDGFPLVMAYAYVPGGEQIAAQLAPINVDLRLVEMTNDEIRVALEGGEIHLALVTWLTPEEQQAWYDLFGAEYTLDLFTLPVSYRTIPELTITFTPGGWPIARR